MQPPINLRNVLAPHTRLLWFPLQPLLRKLNVNNAIDDRVRDVHALRAEFFGETRGQGP